jgi:hypothetical protein
MRRTRPAGLTQAVGTHRDARLRRTIGRHRPVRLEPGIGPRTGVSLACGGLAVSGGGAETGWWVGVIAHVPIIAPPATGRYPGRPWSLCWAFRVWSGFFPIVRLAVGRAV